MRDWKWICGVAAMATTFAVIAPTRADACSIAPPMWQVLQNDNVTAAATGPFVLLLQGWGEPELNETTFEIVVTDGAQNIIEGSQTIIRGDSPNVARLAWSPNEPLEEGGLYLLTATNLGDFGGAVEVDLVPTALEAGRPAITLSATEIEVAGGDRQCCDLYLPENSAACFSDNCGGETFDSCRACWNTAYDYPVQVDVSWQVPTELPSNYFGYRIVEMNEIDEQVRVLAQGDVLESTVSVQLPPDADDGLVAIRLELVDMVTEGDVRPSETAFLIERDEDEDIVRIPHRTPDNSDSASRCAADTTVVVDEDGSETPIPDIVDPGEDECILQVDGCGLDGNLVGDGEKRNVGGCSSTANGGSTGALLFAMALGLIRRRRQ